MLPEERKAIGTKWIFRTKFQADGTILKQKARLVAKGYVQKLRINFEETFAPVLRMETIRVFLTVTTKRRWPVFYLNVKSTFLNREINELKMCM